MYFEFYCRIFNTSCDSVLLLLTDTDLSYIIFYATILLFTTTTTILPPDNVLSSEMNQRNGLCSSFAEVKDSWTVHPAFVGIQFSGKWPDIREGEGKRFQNSVEPVCFQSECIT
jgi:hypothetical protein